MRKLVITTTLAALLIFPSLSFGQGQNRQGYQNGYGRQGWNQSRTYTPPGRTHYYGPSGQYQGSRSFDNRGNSSYYGRSGQYLGRSYETQHGSSGRTWYFDRGGRYLGNESYAPRSRTYQPAPTTPKPFPYRRY